jgi:hypothetical protein
MTHSTPKMLKIEVLILLPLHNGEEDDLWIPSPFTHAIIIHHYDFSLSQVIQSKNLPKSRYPYKETLDGTLTLQIVFQGNYELVKVDNL